MFTVKEILKLEVAPALGCTEPAAIALGAAVATDLLPEKKIDKIEIWIDPNLYKNGLAVSIPGTNGKSGLSLAAALGAVGGDSSKKLEVLDSLNEDALKEAEKLVKDGKVKVNLKEDTNGIYVKTVITSGKNIAESEIRQFHDNITKLILNGKEIKDNPLLTSIKKSETSIQELEKWLSSLTLNELIALLDDLDDEDYEFIKEGVETNLALSEYGLKYGTGLGIGLAHERMIKQKLMAKDMTTVARMLTSAASDARMSGVKLPAMSSAGSGNHGLTAILPIWAVKDFVEIDDIKEVYRAIALSHIITAYIKAHTGRLSAICGCSVAAGAGATAGITLLLGGNANHIAGAIKNLIQDLAGVICDGAKAGCALKLATAAGTATRSALLSLQGIVVAPTDGIISESPEDTMKNLGTLSSKGMIETDRTILQIMIDKQFSHE